jgi:hypothetical protein
MSTEIGVRCKTCKEDSDTGIKDFFVSDMQRIIKLAPELKALKDKDTENDLDVGIQYSWQGEDYPTEFIAKHGGHELVVRNEYGHEYDEKGKVIRE